mgnify:CR=1 FL=1
MSLYFNWSCDFQRFTKSKKLSKFQVRTTTLFISNKILSTSLFNLQGTIRCFQAFFRTFRSSELLFNSLFIISDCFSFVKNFFQNFFEVFEAILSKLKLFLTAVSFETAYLLYQTEIRLSRTFFVLFKPLFRSTAAPLSDSFNRIPQHSPSCQHKFSGFFIFRFSAACAGFSRI